MSGMFATVRDLCAKNQFIEANELLLAEVQPVASGTGGLQEAELYYYHGYCIYMHYQRRVQAWGYSLCKSCKAIAEVLGLEESSEDESAESSDSASEEDCIPKAWEYLEAAREYFMVVIEEENVSADVQRSVHVYLSNTFFLLGLLSLEGGKPPAVALEEFQDALVYSKAVFEENHPYSIALNFFIGKSFSLLLSGIPDSVKYFEKTLELLHQKGRKTYKQTTKDLPLIGFVFYTDITEADVTEALDTVKCLLETPGLVDALCDEPPPDKPVEKPAIQFDLGVKGGSINSESTTTSTFTIVPTQNTKQNHKGQKRKRKDKKADQTKGRKKSKK